ncbi:MAG: universal stress protein [Phycisphaerae bacterium]|nr:universal stress protein [Phycisphaerae bacterium]
MPTIRRILLPVDFSRCSLTALAQARRIATRARADLSVLHVVEPILVNRSDAWIDVPVPTVDDQIDAARARWAQFKAQVSGADTLDCNIVVGHPYSSIEERLGHVQPDLLVMGAHGSRDAFRGAGYVAMTAVANAPVPVLAVHPGNSGEYHTVLAGFDFTPACHAAVRHAAWLARLDAGRLVIAHFYDDPWDLVDASKRPKGADAASADRFLRAARERLIAACQPLLDGLASDKVEYLIEPGPSPGKGLIDLSQRLKADAIAMGTKGRTGLKSILLGSQAERVLREVPCSVLAVKPDPDA